MLRRRARQRRCRGPTSACRRMVLVLLALADQRRPPAAPSALPRRRSAGAPAVWADPAADARGPIGRWLAAFRARHLPRLQRVNALVVARAIRHAGLRRLTIDVDGSVVSTGQQVQWAQRGFNPHHRKVPSYYPITAYEAQSGQVLRVQNRPGNVHDGKARPPLPARLSLAQLPCDARRRATRSNSAWMGRFSAATSSRCWSRPGRRVRDQGALLSLGRPQRRVRAGHAQLDAGRGDGELRRARRRAWRAWGGRRFRVVVYRRRVQHETAKNFQLDLFDPSDGHYEYSAVVDEQDAQRAGALGLHVWPRRPREGVRRAQARLRLRLRADDALRREQRLAAPQRAGLQPHARLPDSPPRPRRRAGDPQTAQPSSASRPSTRCATSACIAPASSSDPMATRRSTSVPPRPSSDRFKRLDRLLAA